MKAKPPSRVTQFELRSLAKPRPFICLTSAPEGAIGTDFAARLKACPDTNRFHYASANILRAANDKRQTTFSSLVIEPKLHRHLAARVIGRQGTEIINSLQCANRRLVQRWNP